jgi:hypothetical protein
MRLKVRRNMWSKEYKKTIEQFQGNGLVAVKCRHNGTSAAEKTFQIADNSLQWNTGMFSKMKQGVQLVHTTVVSANLPYRLLYD